MCIFEWAVPLDSGDNDDLRARPGDSFRFNVVYFDGFQLPMTKTRMGGVYGVQLDKADEWGTLRLAANVKDDGGTAFQSPAWVKALAERLKSVSPRALRVTSDDAGPGIEPADSQGARVVHLPRSAGQEKEAKAKIYLPESVHAQGKRPGTRCSSPRATSCPTGPSKITSSAAGSSSRPASSRPTP